jgi:hypothetical protein
MIDDDEKERRVKALAEAMRLTLTARARMEAMMDRLLSHPDIRDATRKRD